MSPITTRTERGFSLMEVVVAAGVAGVIGTMLMAAFVATMNFTRRGAAEVEAKQWARLALSQIAEELRETRGGPEAIAVWPATEGAPFEALGFLSARQEGAGRPFGTDANGSPTWRTAVYYVFHRERGELRRIARPWEGTLAVPADEAGRVVARGVQDMSVRREPDVWKITMDVRAGRGTVRFDTAVRPRN